MCHHRAPEERQKGPTHHTSSLPELPTGSPVAPWVIFVSCRSCHMRPRIPTWPASSHPSPPKKSKSTPLLQRSRVQAAHGLAGALCLRVLASSMRALSVPAHSTQEGSAEVRRGRLSAGKVHLRAGQQQKSFRSSASASLFTD